MSDLFIYGSNNYGGSSVSSGISVCSGGTAQSVTLALDPGGSARMVVCSGGLANYTMVSGGTMTIMSGGVANSATTFYTGAKVVVSSGGLVRYTTISAGTMTIMPGGVASNTTVSSNGWLYLSSGAKLTGRTVFDGGFGPNIYASAESIIDFDISSVSPDASARFNRVECITGSPLYTITVSQSQESGTYKLIENYASLFNSTITVQYTSGKTLGTLGVGEKITVGQREYALSVKDNSHGNYGNYALVLTVSGQPIETDAIAPTVTNVRANNTVLTNQNVTVTADFTDNVAVETRQYRINSGSWMPYSNGVTVSNNSKIYFRAIDTSGNISGEVMYTVDNIDKVAPAKPSVSANITTPTNGSVKLTAVFSADSVKNEYSLDGKNWVAYPGAIRLDENDTVYFRGKDAAGNASEVVRYEVGNIDKTPPRKPTASADITTETEGKVTVTGVFSDDSAKKEYSLDGLVWQDYGSAIEFSVNGKVYFRGTDAAGNVSDIVLYEVKNIKQKTSEQPDDPPQPVDPSEVSPDDGWNNVLYDRKTGLAPQASFFNKTLLNKNVSAILLDYEDSVSNEIDGVVYRNFVGKGDETDFAMISLKHGAKLSFDIESTGAAKFTIWSLSARTGRNAGSYTMKSLQTTLVQAGSATTKEILLASGDYYVSMEASNAKKGGSAFYNVSINEDDTNGSVFYPQGNNEDDWTDMKTEGAGSAMLDDLGMVTPETTDLINDWVGFGDTVDYKRFTLEYAAELDFAFGAPDGFANVSVCKLKETTKNGVTTYSLTNIKTATIKANQTSARLNDLRLEAGEYFIKAEYTNAKKGNGTDYTVSIADSRFYSDGDNGDNNWLYDKKTKEVNVSVMDGFVSEIDTDHIGELLIDESDTVLYDEFEGYEFHNFVGFGDEADYAKISVARPGTATFKVTATDAAKLVVYQLTYNKKGEVSGAKAVQTVTLKKNAAGLFETPANTKACNFKQPGDYYISVQATAKKNETTYYNVSLVSTDIAAPLLVNQSAQDMCALTRPETDSLADSPAMPDSLSFAQADALSMPMAATAYADSMQDKLLGESSWGLLASL